MPVGYGDWTVTRHWVNIMAESWFSVITGKQLLCIVKEPPSGRH